MADADESSKRHVDEVALEEVGALMHHILNEAGGTSRQELTRIACRMLGMSRVPADAESRAGQALDGLAARGKVLLVGDHVRAAP